MMLHIVSSGVSHPVEVLGSQEMDFKSSFIQSERVDVWLSWVKLKNLTFK